VPECWKEDAPSPQLLNAPTRPAEHQHLPAPPPTHAPTTPIAPDILHRKTAFAIHCPHPCTPWRPGAHEGLPNENTDAHNVENKSEDFRTLAGMHLFRLWELELMRVGVGLRMAFLKPASASVVIPSQRSRQRSSSSAGVDSRVKAPRGRAMALQGYPAEQRLPRASASSKIAKAIR
jgi:hypothetical protein